VEDGQNNDDKDRDFLPSLTSPQLPSDVLLPLLLPLAVKPLSGRPFLSFLYANYAPSRWPAGQRHIRIA
jgi:hypothetical protein